MFHILVTGSNGQLGNEIRKLAPSYVNFNFVFTDIEELDITSKKNIQQFFSSNKPGCVINCAAYTAVDKAESDREKAMLINADAVRFLAEYCKDNNTLLVHISTDYVFDGTKKTPYLEVDPVNPLSFYGKSKSSGEKHILEISPPAIIIRTSWLYSSFGGNFVKTILKLAREKGILNVVNDQFGSPTYAADLAHTILQIIPKASAVKEPEILNYSNEGIITWFEFAKAIIEFKHLECVINPVTAQEYPTPAVRPNYSAFSKDKIISRYGISIPRWEDSLKSCLLLID